MLIPLPRALVCLAVGAALPLSSAQAAVVHLQPYRAVYDLTLASARQGSGVLGLKGRMVLEWADACDGFTLNQRMGFRINRLEIDEMVSDVVISTWESRDGTTLRYSMRSTINNRVVEEYRGKAELEAPGAKGHASFTRPEAQEIKLAPGTFFPTEHTRDLIARAMAGEKRISSTLFEGTSGDVSYDSVAFIDKAYPPTADGVHELLADLPSWRMNIAFFKQGGDSNVPEYEVRLRMFANGVGSDVELNYGDFTVGGALSRLEYLPESGC